MEKADRSPLTARCPTAEIPGARLATPRCRSARPRRRFVGPSAPARRPTAPTIGGWTRSPALAGGFGPPAATPGIGGGGASDRGGSGRWVRCGTAANVCGAERSSRAREGMGTPHGCGAVRGRCCGRQIGSSGEGKERVGGNEWL